MYRTIAGACSSLFAAYHNLGHFSHDFRIIRKNILGYDSSPGKSSICFRKNSGPKTDMPDILLAFILLLIFICYFLVLSKYPSILH